MNSSKSVIEKLNVNKYENKLILYKPQDVEDFDEVEFDVEVKKEKYDFICAFIFDLNEFSKVLQEVLKKQLLKDNGYLFIAYPKKNNPKYDQYIERDSIYTEDTYTSDGYVHGSNLKFSRMISLNDVFTIIGMKAIPQKAQKAKSTKSSQCVDDYIEHIELIKAYIKDKENISELYESLTPGYQKDWARYVYSAKRKETQEKRLSDMESILEQGYKSMDLYRRKKK
ncbi:YdeI/OmpD-associated family protein [Mangrovibacillus cuniculi]|uniref:YdeI/OmpD-associated family protein n=1 Tax=Mangrovibacillus cuniculi TaxID=2593652 RepID=A0A7S8CDC0_9BACI|nr:YdeI/OmpD-associated family protein [Mangrovibacillus cuniculi]QPC47897.1 YdeI/OmpD-associated family protein [Mangrovibacillus cuniculi]